MGELHRAGNQIARSERLRVAGLAFLTCILALVFLMLLVADGVQAAGI